MSPQTTDQQTPQFASSSVAVPELTPPTGFDEIDGLLESRKWANPTITFSFPDSFTLDYAADYPRYATHAESFRQAPQGLQSVVRHWLSQISSVSGLRFVEFDGPEDSETEDEEAVMRIALSNDPVSAYAYSPWDSDEAGDLMFNNETYGDWFDQAKMGEYAWHTIGHELSHALGLKHGHEGGGVADVAVPPEQDSMEFSIMTYRSYENQAVTGVYANAYGNYAQTLMMLDIQALQTLYGANYTTNAGDTLYSFSDQTGELLIDGESQGQPVLNTIFRTVWDGNGEDTYDFSTYTTPLSINLSPGGYIDLDQGGNRQRALLGASEQIYARGHVFNSLLFNDDPRSLIEHALGGAGNDEIQGNIAANRLGGGDGNDQIAGGDGNDTLLGGLGEDELTGGIDADVFVLEADGQRDRITDFEVGLDQLDLSAWGITDVSQLQLTVNPDSLELAFEDEILDLDNVDADGFDVTTILGVPNETIDNPNNGTENPTDTNSDTPDTPDTPDHTTPAPDTPDTPDATDGTDVGDNPLDDTPSTGDSPDEPQFETPPISPPETDTSETDTSDTETLATENPVTPNGRIQGQVRRDNDGDGSLTDTDPGLGGVTLQLFQDSNQDGVPDAAAIATTKANSNGFYSFANLAYGQYIVAEINPNRYTSTADADGANPDQIMVTIDSNIVRTQQDFLDVRILADKKIKTTGTQQNDQIEGSAQAEKIFGRGGNDSILGDGGNDDIFGNGGDDELRGGAGDDKIRGEAGNDKLRGNRGDDLLKGTNARSKGAGERDVLRGGPGADEFVIGNGNSPYYIAAGTKDYALIADFKPIADTVILHGSAKQYKTTQNASKTLLWFHAAGDEAPELVASFANTSRLNLKSNSFHYV